MDNSNRPDVRAYIGSTGSGKGVSIRDHLKAVKAKRLLVWDPLDEYGAFCKLKTRDLAAVAQAMKAPAFTISYFPGPNAKLYEERFDMFCRLAFAAGDLHMLVEELSNVTSPSYAPASWQRCTTQGRHRRLRIIAASQRPAQVDKDFFGNCTYIRCFALRYPADRKAMAGGMNVPLAQLDELRTIEGDTHVEINWLEADFRSGKTTPGTKKLPVKR
ncbi:MAG: hypothetical protein J0H69_00605 [Burkholderiales bacterium]|nr:hypothetical protein [Burkholderiales bacterium]